MSRHIFTKSKAQGILIALEYIAFQNIAQGDQSHFIVWHFDAHVTMARHGRLDADARRSKGEGEIIRQRGDLVDADLRPPGSGLDEERFHAELCDRWSAVNFHYLNGSAERSQCFRD